MNSRLLLVVVAIVIAFFSSSKSTPTTNAQTTSASDLPGSGSDTMSPSDLMSSTTAGTESGGGGGGSSNSDLPTSTTSSLSTQTPASGAVTVLDGKLRISYIFRNQYIWWSLSAPIAAGKYMAVAVSSGSMAGKGVACRQPDASDPSRPPNCTCITNTASFTSSKRAGDTPSVASFQIMEAVGWVSVTVRVDAALMDVTPGPKRVIFSVGNWDSANEMVTRHGSSSSDRGFETFDFFQQTTSTGAPTTTTQLVLTSETTQQTDATLDPNQTTTTTTMTTITTETPTSTPQGSSSSGSGSGSGSSSTPTTTASSSSDETIVSSTSIDSNSTESAAATATTTSNTTTTSPHEHPAAAWVPLSPLDDTLSLEAEARARGVLTFVAALMSPVIGPSGIFDTTRALSVFTFARCSHQNYSAVKRASTEKVPFPEAIFPILVGPPENGYLRGAVLANLVVVPLICGVLSIALGFHVDRRKPGKLLPIPGPKPTSTFGIAWARLCDFMYYGSTITLLVIVLALGFDGAVSSIFSMFSTPVNTADESGDTILSIVYLTVVAIFLIRVAYVLYQSTPTRFFTTPGMIKKKVRPNTAKPVKELPDWVADLLGGFWGRFFVVGDWVWRPGSARSYRQLRECAALFRRFHGPRDEDRAAMAVAFTKMQAAAAAAAGVTPTVRVNIADGEEQQQQQNSNQQDASRENGEQKDEKSTENDGTKSAEATNDDEDDAAREKNEGGQEAEKKKSEGEETIDSGGGGDGGGRKQKEASLKTKQREQQKQLKVKQREQQKENQPPSEPINWRMYFRRILLTNFFFVEFIFVFFISLLKGVARVTEAPSDCRQYAMGAALVNLFFFVFILAIRPFVVPARNALAIVSSLLAVVASFLAAVEGGSGVAAGGLAVLAAILPIFYFLLTGVPRLMMRFVWGLQHAPGKQIPLRDPAKPPPPPEVLEQEKRRLQMQDAQTKVPLRELMKQRHEQGGDATLAQPLLGSLQEGSPAWKAEQERLMVEQGVGALSRLQKIFFPPPPQPTRQETSSYGDIDNDLADSFGGDDDDDDDMAYGRHDDDEDDDDVYLSKMLSSATSRTTSPQREMQLRDVQIRVQSLQKQLHDAEAALYSPTSPTAFNNDNNRTSGNAQFQFAGHTTTHGTDGTATAGRRPASSSSLVGTPFGLGSDDGFNQTNRNLVLLSPPRVQGFIPAAPTPSAHRGKAANAASPQGLLHYQTPGQKAPNPRVAQEMALAGLLYQICSTRKSANDM